MPQRQASLSTLQSRTAKRKAELKNNLEAEAAATKKKKKTGEKGTENTQNAANSEKALAKKGKDKKATNAKDASHGKKPSLDSNEIKKSQVATILVYILILIHWSDKY